MTFWKVYILILGKKAYISNIGALSIIDKLVTGLFGELIESVENVLNCHWIHISILILKVKLSELCHYASPLLRGETILPDIPINNDQIYVSLFSETDDPVIKTYTEI